MAGWVGVDGCCCRCRTTAELIVSPKKKRRRGDDYEPDADFIDDSEIAAQVAELNKLQVKTKHSGFYAHGGGVAISAPRLCACACRVCARSSKRAAACVCVCVWVISFHVCRPVASPATQTTRTRIFRRSVAVARRCRRASRARCRSRVDAPLPRRYRRVLATPTASRCPRRCKPPPPRCRKRAGSARVSAAPHHWRRRASSSVPLCVGGTQQRSPRVVCLRRATADKAVFPYDQDAAVAALDGAARKSFVDGERPSAYVAWIARLLSVKESEIARHLQR